MMIFGFLPICIPKFRKVKLLMTISNCFTAGLFIASGLVHILPEASEMFELAAAASGDDHSGHDHSGHGHGIEGDAHSEEGHSHGISYPHFIVLMAFSFILFIEKVLLNFHKQKKKEKSEKTEESGDTQDAEKEKLLENGSLGYNTKEGKKETENQGPDPGRLQNKDEMNGKSETRPNSYQQTINDIEVTYTPIQVNDSAMEVKKEDDIEKQKNSNQNVIIDVNNVETNDPKQPKKKEKKTDDHDHDHDHDDHGHDHLEISNKSSIISIIVVLFALGIHGFMANLTVGIEDNKDSLITLIIAIAIHKWSEGLAVGIILVKKKFSTSKSIFVILFIAIFSPIGGITGLLLESADNYVKGSMLAISAAAFLYIAIAEIILEEFKYADYKYLKILFYALGIGLVMLLFAV